MLHSSFISARTEVGQWRLALGGGWRLALPMCIRQGYVLVRSLILENFFEDCQSVLFCRLV